MLGFLRLLRPGPGARSARILHEGPAGASDRPPRGRRAQKKTRVRGAWLLLALACPPLALAWGPQGHRTVGAIADQLLTPQARAVVAQLLAQDLDKFGNPSGRTTLEAVSVWADELHGTPAARARWHYDDEPVCGGGPKVGYCRDGDCGSEALKRQLSLLADPRTPRRERNEALKWVVHLVGDLHQPLHAADNDDRGGNSMQVALSGVKTRGRESLHRAWDGDFVKLALHARSGQQPPAAIGTLVREASVLWQEAGQGSPDSWVTESNNLARNVAYRYAGFACGRPPGGIVVLDAHYVADAAGLARERLLLAGARLGAVLNQSLGGR